MRDWVKDGDKAAFMQHWGSPTGRKEMATLVIGMGNPLLGDDGVGWRVAAEIEQRCLAGPLPAHQRVEIDFQAVGGLRLMERMTGYDRAILIDALTTGSVLPGSLTCLKVDDLPQPGGNHLASAHDATLLTAIEVGRAMGARLPQHIWVVGIEAQRIYDFTEELSPAVEAAIPEAVQKVMDLIEWSSSPENELISVKYGG